MKPVYFYSLRNGGCVVGVQADSPFPNTVASLQLEFASLAEARVAFGLNVADLPNQFQWRSAKASKASAKASKASAKASKASAKQAASKKASEQRATRVAAFDVDAFALALAKALRDRM